MVRKYDTLGSETNRDRCEEGAKERDIERRRTKGEQKRPISKFLRVNGNSAQRRCQQKSPKLPARGLVYYISLGPLGLDPYTGLQNKKK